jgi:hypothetical protein
MNTCVGKLNTGTTEKRQENLFHAESLLLKLRKEMTSVTILNYTTSNY